MKGQLSLGLVLTACALAVLGCSGASDVGEQESPPPVAWAKALNQPFTGSDGNITLSVRAGAEVFLSAKDSFGTTLPVINYRWEAADAATQDVKLLLRNASTVSFTAPQTGTRRTLSFKLTVADSNEASDDATVTVFVEAAGDPDAFLQYGGAATYTITAVTDAVYDLPADVAFDITVEKRISYWDLAGQRHEDRSLGTQTLSGHWLRAYGTGGTDSSCGGLQNPRFKLPVPSLDLDDVLAQLSTSVADQAQAADPSRVDDASVTLKFTIVSPSLPAGMNPGVCILGVDAATSGASFKMARASAALAAGSVAAEKVVTLEQIMGVANRLRDTKASAQAYYASIDPPAAKDTLAKWLTQTGFTNGATDWASIEQGSSAHAVYLNNFDLGFGRDMYMRMGACDGGVQPTLGASIDPALRGKCDIFAVVTNYVSLEAAAKKTGAFVAVAMEYSRLPGAAAGDARVTTFYTFAPDRSGVFRRVLSANLDGRGEKYLPQACIVCHGGKPNGVEMQAGAGGTLVPVDANADGIPDRYGNGGNVNAGFMTWDLDSFIYSDTDPSFSTASDPYFPADEQALATAYTRTQQEASFRKLNQMAYLTYANPDPTSPNPALSQRFDLARGLVESWYGGAGLPNATFSDADVPLGWRNDVDGNPHDAATIYREVFAQNCRACHVLQVPGVAENQLAMGSYADFFNASKLADVLGSGSMPFARMTMDRLWTNGAGPTLQEHLVDRGKGFAMPGTATWCITPGALTPDRGAAVQFSGSCSRFTNAYPWRVLGPDGAVVPLIGAGTVNPVFYAMAEGSYQVTLGEQGSTQAQASVTVAKSVPQAGSTITPLPKELPMSGSLIFDVDVISDLGSISRDPIRAIHVTGMQNVASAIPSPDAPTSKIRITANALAPGLSNVSYALEDSDGDMSVTDGLIELNVGASLTLGVGAITLDSNGQTSINLNSLVPNPPAGQAIGFEITSQPLLSRERGAGSVSLSGATATYVAPKGVATQVKSSGLPLAPGELDSFGFAAYFVARPTARSIGTVRAELQAPTDFSLVAGELRGKCSTCHAALREGSALVNSAADAEQTTYCTILAGRTVTGATGLEADGLPYVSLATPAESVMYQKVHGLLGHGGGNVVESRNFNAAALLAWIDEGGYFTGATTQPVCTVTPPPNVGTPTAGNATTTIEWIDASNNWVDIDVGQLAGTSNAVVISTADIIASGAVTGTRPSGSLILRVTLTSLAGAPGQVGTVQYKVKNLRGELSGTGTISVFGTAVAPVLKPGMNAFTSTVAVNSTANTVLANLSANDKIDPIPGGLTLACARTSGPGLSQNPLVGAAQATANVSCSSVVYTPPLRTQTRLGSTRFVAADTVSYRLCYAGSTICSPVVTVSVDVAGSRSFGGIHTSMNQTNGCTGSCHEGPSNAASSHWTYTAANARTTYCSIRNGTSRSGGSLLNFATPASSAIYSVPNSGLLTDGGSHSSRAALASEVLLWVQEGGYFTEAASQACP